MSKQEFDFETIADGADFDLGNDYDPSITVMAGAQLHFKTAPCIIEALTARASTGLYGWTDSGHPRYLSAVQRWMSDVRGWAVEKEWIVPSYGTLQAMCAAMRTFTNEGDGVIVQPPVYVLYDRILNRTGRRRVDNPLRLWNKRYYMDFDGLEQQMAQPENKLMLLCNPHNPTMDVWERTDLERVAALAKRYGVLVIADEIYAEHIFPGGTDIPYATLPDAKDNCIVTTSIGKSFNFTGMSHANIIIPDQAIRERFIIQRNRDHYGSLDPFMYNAIQAAYTPEGKEWIDALLGYVAENITLFRTFLAEHLPQVTMCRHQAGTLVWADFRSLELSEDDLHAFLGRAGITADRGSQYGEGGEGFCRLQLGMPRKELTFALQRLEKTIKTEGIGL